MYLFYMNTLIYHFHPYLDNMDAMVVSSNEDFAKQVIKGVKPFATRDND